jgi:hypothetical protein
MVLLLRRDCRVGGDGAAGVRTGRRSMREGRTQIGLVPRRGRIRRREEGLGVRPLGRGFAGGRGGRGISDLRRRQDGVEVGAG